MEQPMTETSPSDEEKAPPHASQRLHDDEEEETEPMITSLHVYQIPAKRGAVTVEIAPTEELEIQSLTDPSFNHICYNNRTSYKKGLDNKRK